MLENAIFCKQRNKKRSIFVFFQTLADSKKHECFLRNNSVCKKALVFKFLKCKIKLVFAKTVGFRKKMFFGRNI